MTGHRRTPTRCGAEWNQEETSGRRYPLNGLTVVDSYPNIATLDSPTQLRVGKSASNGQVYGIFNVLADTAEREPLRDGCGCLSRCRERLVVQNQFFEDH